MSRDNVKKMRRATEAFNRGDYAGYLADFAPGFEYVSSGVIPGGGGVYRGHEEYTRFLEELWEGFEDTRAEVHEFIEGEDQVVVSLTIQARGKRSGAETTWSFLQVWTFQNGRVVRGQGFPERRDALKAAGLSE